MVAASFPERRRQNVHVNGPKGNRVDGGVEGEVSERGHIAATITNQSSDGLGKIAGCLTAIDDRDVVTGVQRRPSDPSPDE